MTELSPQSKAVEDFLKAVYTLQQQSDRVSTNTLSEVLEITAPSVTDMAQRMVAAGLVDYQKYRGVILTPAGEVIALKIIRRHRLIELYLVRELGYELHEVHREAEQLEHAVSDKFVAAVARKLGNPDFDPHGDPIPAPDGSMHLRLLMPLSELPEHMPARVRQLKTSDPSMLQHILDRGFILETTVEVIARDPFDGPITVRIDAQERIIGPAVAAAILVETGEDPTT